MLTLVLFNPLDWFAEELYRAVNCCVRYARSSIYGEKGVFFHYRVSQLLGQNLFKEIFYATKEFIYKNEFEVVQSAIYPYTIFKKGVEFNRKERDILKDILSISCLKDIGVLERISWDSNLLDNDWNPERVSVKGEAELLTLWSDDLLSRKAPFRFRKWLIKTVQPHKDPLAFLLFVLRRLGLFHPLILTEPFDYVIFKLITPRLL